MAIEININKRNQVNTPLGVLSKIADNIYLSIKIISWSNNQAGGFSYQRTSTS